MIDKEMVIETAKKAGLFIEKWREINLVRNASDMEYPTLDQFITFATLLQKKIEQDAERRGFELGIKVAAEVCGDTFNWGWSTGRSPSHNYVDAISSLSYDTVKEKKSD